VDLDVSETCECCAASSFRPAVDLLGVESAGFVGLSVNAGLFVLVAKSLCRCQVMLGEW
jgi:hypothetical protein